MSSVTTEPLEQVLDMYDLKVQSIKNESYKDKKGVWWIQVQDGYKILKKISNSEDTLKYILSAVNHLCKKGINIPKVNATKDGNEYVVLDGVCYVLSDAIQGKNPSYNISRELELIVKELGKFHKGSKGFFPSPSTKPKVHLGRWVNDYTDSIKDMENFYIKEQDTNPNNETGKYIIKEFPYFFNTAKEAIEELKGTEYQMWTEKVKILGGLCHQDYAAGNILLDKDNIVYILDTDSLTIDIPARDLRKLLNKIMKKNGKWDMELTKKIFSYYQKENPLSKEEWKVVKMDLLYPHLFLGAMNKFYYRRDKEWSDEKYLKRIKEMSIFQKTISPVIENFDTLIPE